MRKNTFIIYYLQRFTLFFVHKQEKNQFIEFILDKKGRTQLHGLFLFTNIPLFGYNIFPTFRRECCIYIFNIGTF